MLRKMGRVIKTMLTIILAVALGALLAIYIIPRLTATHPIHHTGPTIAQIQQLSELVTLKVEVSDIVETTLNGYTGGVKAVLVVKGDVLVSTDLSQAKLISVDSKARRAVLLLPSPRVISPRIDHQHSRIAVLQSHGLWQFVPGDGGAGAKLMDKLHIDAQQTIAAASADPQVMKQARDHAERVLKSWFEAIDWRVEVRWGEE